MGFFEKLFKKKDTQEIQTQKKFAQPNFIGKRKTPSGTYEVYRAGNAESAKDFLKSKKVDENKYYIKVETPEGNWGVDIDGLYLEKLLSYQLNINAAEHEGEVHGIPDNVGLQYAAEGISDNFLVEIECGGCKHHWVDGLRYQNFTVVRCPGCNGLNKVDSSNIHSVSKKAAAEPKKEQPATTPGKKEIKTDVTINAPIDKVWKYITTNYYWGVWWGKDIRHLEPGWEQGAVLQFSGSHEPKITIDKLIPEESIQFAMNYMRIHISLFANDNETTRVEIESIPVGAKFPDGGANQNRIMSEKLTRLKNSLK